MVKQPDARRLGTALEENVKTKLARELALVPADQDGAVLLDATRFIKGLPDVQAMFATRVGKNWSGGTSRARSSWRAHSTGRTSAGRR